MRVKPEVLNLNMMRFSLNKDFVTGVKDCVSDFSSSKEEGSKEDYVLAVCRRLFASDGYYLGCLGCISGVFHLCSVWLICYE